MTTTTRKDNTQCAGCNALTTNEFAPFCHACCNRIAQSATTPKDSK